MGVEGLARPLAQARRAGLNDARAFLDKAREFLRAAQDSLELTNNTAAVGNAVHAGISTQPLGTPRRASATADQ